MSEPLPAQQLRASDADREAVVERLRDAAGDGRLTIDELDQRIGSAYAARTYAELEPLTHDLPEQQSPATRPAGAPGPPARVSRQPGRRWSAAVMSGADRRGSWRIGEQHNAVAVMGGVHLDLRDADLEAPLVTIRAFALMGGVEVTIPDDCAMDASGFGLMGGFDHADKAPPPPPGAPVVRVRGLALMGSIDVKRRTRRRSGEPGEPPPALER